MDPEGLNSIKALNDLFSRYGCCVF